VNPENALAHTVLARSIRWLERAVIGLNLCPFAKAVHVKKQIVWRISYAEDTEQVAQALEQLLLELDAAEPEQTDTAVLVLPYALSDFYAYNDFLGDAEQLLESLAFDGVFQIASFHPDYCFAGEKSGALSNATNQAPYPMLHILREASVTKAADAFPDAAKITSRNQITLQNLGHEGWLKLRASILSD
jgi:uncharacterized protein